MRLTSLIDPPSCRTAPLSSRRTPARPAAAFINCAAGRTWAAGWGLAAACTLAVACATPPPPVPEPIPVLAAPPAPPPVPVSAPPPVVDPGPPPIIIHHADLHGRFESQKGLTLTIRALLVMNKNRPEVGNKGVLYCAPPGATGDEEWVPLGDVEVHKPLDGDGRMQVKITGDDKKFVLPGAKKPTPLSRNTRIRLNWEW